MIPNIEEYENEFRLQVDYHLDRAEDLGKWFNECCCQYTGPDHGKWVEKITNWLIDEVRKVERNGGVD